MIPNKALIVDANLSPEDREAAQAELGSRIVAVQSKVAGQHPPYSYPKTREEWWATVDEYWDELLVLVGYEFNLNAMADPNGKPVKAPLSDASENAILEAFVTGTPKPIIVAEYAVGKPLALVLEDMRKARSLRIFDLVNDVWAAAPDRGEIHARPAWDVLCDLCSEGAHLLYDVDDLADHLTEGEIADIDEATES